MEIDGICISFLAKHLNDLVLLLNPHFKLEFLSFGVNNKILFHRTVGDLQYQVTVMSYWEEKDFRRNNLQLHFYGKSSRFFLELNNLQLILSKAIGCPRLDVKIWHNYVISNQDLVYFYAEQMKYEMFRKEQGKRYQKMQMLQSEEGDVSVSIGSRARTRLFTRISKKYLELELSRLNKDVLESLKNGSLTEFAHNKLNLLANQLIFAEVTHSLHNFSGFAHYSNFKKYYSNKNNKFKMYNLYLFRRSNYNERLVELYLYLYCLNHLDSTSWNGNSVQLKFKFADFIQFFDIKTKQICYDYLISFNSNTENRSILQSSTNVSYEKFSYFTVIFCNEALFCPSNQYMQFSNSKFVANLKNLPKIKTVLRLSLELLADCRDIYPGLVLEYDFTGDLPSTIDRQLKFHNNLNLIIDLLVKSDICIGIKEKSPNLLFFGTSLWRKVKRKS